LSNNSHKYDLFVSYAHVDNEDGWVRQFVAKLNGALAIRNGGKPLNIFFDNRRIQANSVLEDMLSAARNSKLFLAIGSRAYVSNERFTIKELIAFDETVQDASRIFVILTLPLRESERWPEAIATHTPQSFFDSYEDSEAASTLTLEADGVRYLREVNRLAEQIVRKLGQLAAPSVVTPFGAKSDQLSRKIAPGFERKRVLIAQSTDGLEDEAADLRAYLSKFGDGLEILPYGPYPQGGAEFKAAYLLDLDRADLVVSLLDRRAGRCPPDLPEGYSMFQLNAAREHNVAMMQWRDPRIDLNEISNTEYREVLVGSTVTACGFNEFKEAVRKAALTPVAKDRPKNGAIVYVHASPNDMEMALRIGENCGKYKLFCHLPQFEQKTINTRAVRERLSTSNAVLFLYCNADIGWAQREAEAVYKYSRRDGDQVIALCFGPPEKSDMFVFPDARIIKGSSESELFSKIDVLLKELTA
jgi:hypothetical protein